MQILSTKNYDQFKTLKGNRTVLKKHVDKLCKAIDEENLLQYRPIIVNEKMEVIDGQHRLEAARILKVEIFYFFVEGSDYKEISLLNSNQRNWTLIDFAKMFAAQGSPEYVYLMELANKTGVQISLLTCFFRGNERTARKRFVEGNFNIDNNINCEKYIYFYIEVYDFFKQKSLGAERAGTFMKTQQFVAGFVNFCMDTEGELDKRLFFKHLEYKIDSVGPKSTRIGYYNMLMNIYNWRMGRNQIINKRAPD